MNGGEKEGLLFERKEERIIIWKEGSKEGISYERKEGLLYERKEVRKEYHMKGRKDYYMKGRK